MLCIPLGFLIISSFRKTRASERPHSSKSEKYLVIFFFLPPKTPFVCLFQCYPLWWSILFQLIPRLRDLVKQYFWVFPEEMSIWICRLPSPILVGIQFAEGPSWTRWRKIKFALYLSRGTHSVFGHQCSWTCELRLKYHWFSRFSNLQTVHCGTSWPPKSQEQIPILFPLHI